MITFFSNFINEHQIPFCEAMYKKTNGEFRFVSTETISQERINMGFQDKSDCFPYIVKAFESDEEFDEAKRLGKESDVVIIGSAGDEFIEDRLRENKLTFRYHERFFKKFRHRLDPRVWLYRYKSDFLNRKKNLHMLCASAYTASDCKFVFSYPNKTYKWGYFPIVKTYDDINEIIKNKRKHSILWVGRLIKLKHPEQAVYIADRLRKDGVSFDMKIIGIGPLEKKIKGLIDELGLSKNVSMLGAMSPEQVREYMQQSEIFLFTSDKNEGWGAVLNESMSSACAVVACKEIGSVPYLIEHEKNGFVYKIREKNKQYEYVKALINDKDLRECIQKNAYATIQNVWNADTAADRFLHLVDCIKKGEDTCYTTGPCSRD